MKLGVNLHSDWGDRRNIRWLKDNTIIRRARFDFPCKKCLASLTLMEHMEEALSEAKDLETVLVHVGYLNGYGPDDYREFRDYIDFVSDVIIRRGLREKAVIEIWNNVNISGFWKGDKDYEGFKEMLIAIGPAISRVHERGIRTAGFSMTLNHGSGWEWLRQMENYIRRLSFATVQIYPESAGQYVELAKRFRMEFPGLDFMVSETGHYGTGEEQLCKYRQLVYEIEYATPDNEVFLYHLFDWSNASKGEGWELINWESGKEYPCDPKEKPAAKYLKESFSFNELEEDLPKDFDCCYKRKWWKKLLCWLKRIF